MKAAYLNQGINLLASILIFPLLLKYLGVGDYILWAIFTAIGGITLQLESSIQTLSVREIARYYHAKDIVGIQRAITKTKINYGLLSASTVCLVLPVGFLYLTFIADGKVGSHWRVEWFVFMCVYSINYFFGANNCILLAMGRLNYYNYVNSITRATYIAGATFLLAAGYSVMGVCVSFAVSVFLGVTLIAVAASRIARGATVKDVRDFKVLDGSAPRLDTWGIVRFALFTFLSFALYKGSVIFATSYFPKAELGSYSLTLQAFTMLSAAAVVPIQIWLGQLVKAIVRNSKDEMIYEIGRALLWTNLVYAIGTIGLVLFGGGLLAHVSTSVVLPEARYLLIAAAAFLVEVNQVILINFLVTKRQFRFIRIYVICAASGLVLANFGVYYSRNLFGSLIAIPFIVQMFVCLPFILKLVSEELGVSRKMFLKLLFKTQCTS